MTVKTIVLRGTAKAVSSETQLDKRAVPAKTSWKLIELRPYCSATSGVTVYLNKGTFRLNELTAEDINTYKLPVPADCALDAGDELVLTAANSASSDATVIVTVVLDETTK